MRLYNPVAVRFETVNAATAGTPYYTDPLQAGIMFVRGSNRSCPDRSQQNKVEFGQPVVDGASQFAFGKKRAPF